MSLAAAKAAAQDRGCPLYAHINELAGSPRMRLPTPMMNILNGGAHANNNVDIQEFMVLPVSQTRFSEALRCGVEVFHHLKAVLGERGLTTAVGDEGGFAPDLASNAEALEVIVEAVGRAGYEPGRDLVLGLDCAASEFYEDGRYALAGGERPLRQRGLHRLSGGLGHPLSDRLHRGRHGRKRLDRLALDDRSPRRGVCSWSAMICSSPTPPCSGAALKPASPTPCSSSSTRSGTRLGNPWMPLAWPARRATAWWSRIVPGESEDVTIADLAVGAGAGQIKTGSLCRSDRVAKYNQLLRIEQALGSDALYLGRAEVPQRMKTVAAMLLLLLLGLQYQSWFGDSGYFKAASLKAQLNARGAPCGAAEAAQPIAAWGR